VTKTLTIIGCGIHDIPAFYAEINRVFMAGEDWTLGESLDGLDDMPEATMVPLKDASRSRLCGRTLRLPVAAWA